MDRWRSCWQRLRYKSSWASSLSNLKNKGTLGHCYKDSAIICSKQSWKNRFWITEITTTFSSIIWQFVQTKFNYMTYCPWVLKKGSYLSRMLLETNMFSATIGSGLHCWCFCYTSIICITPKEWIKAKFCNSSTF